MAGSKPSLIIPLKLDMAEALKQLRDLEKRGEDAGDKAQEGLGKADKAAKGFGATLADLAIHQGYTMAKDLAAAMEAAFKASSDHIKQIADDFIKAQQSMTEIAALMGKGNSDKFTLEQATQAKDANLKTEEWVKFQGQFQSYGGAYLEDTKDAAGNVVEKAKMSQADALKYQQGVAEFAKARGVDPSQAAQLAGGILQFSPGSLTADEGLAQFGKTFKTLERSPTPVNELLPQLTRVMAQGSSPMDAAQLLSLSAEFMPHEEGTAVENTMKAIREASLKGNSGRLGITKDMTDLEKVKAASATIRARIDAGEDEDKVITEDFKDIREFKAMTGFIGRGQRAQGFGRVQGYVDQTADDFVGKSIGDWRNEDGGRRAGLDARDQYQDIARGAKYAGLADIKKEAQIQLKAEGRLEDLTGWGDMARGLLPGTPEVKDQLINERALELAQKKAGTFQGGILGSKGIGTAVQGFGEEQFTVDQMILEALNHIKDSNAKMAADNPGPRPLNAPAPRLPRAPGG